MLGEGCVELGLFPREMKRVGPTCGMEYRFRPPELRYGHLINSQMIFELPRSLLGAP